MGFSNHISIINHKKENVHVFCELAFNCLVHYFEIPIFFQMFEKGYNKHINTCIIDRILRSKEVKNKTSMNLITELFHSLANNTN